MTSDTVTLRTAVLEALSSCVLRDFYPDEQRDLQPELHRALEVDLRARFGGEFRTLIGVGEGSPKPSIRALGTSFWPDIEILRGDAPVLGIEVKYIRQDKSAAKTIAETIGQCLIYRLRYSQVIGFVLHHGKNDIRLVDENEGLRQVLKECGIHLVLRFKGPPWFIIMGGVEHHPAAKGKKKGSGETPEPVGLDKGT